MKSKEETMTKAIQRLVLELPESVWKDVDDKWKEYLTAKYAQQFKDGPQWIKASERLPESEGYYHTKGTRHSSYWDNNRKRFLDTGISQWLEEMPPNDQNDETSVATGDAQSDADGQTKNLSIDELKQRFAEHLMTKNKELDTSDGYALEWTVKQLKS